MVTEKFKNMALSFAGCDGGNLQSEVWFCGMEWGGTQNNDEKIASDFDAQPEPTSWQDKDFKGSWSAQYNQKICWFLHYFYDLYWEKMSYQQFVETYKIMYRKPDGCGFKMNMFPIRFKGRKDVKWDELLGKATGFDSFHAYREWCVTHRGEFFREQMRKNQPKLVMCTGIEEKENCFRFFAGESNYQTLDCGRFTLFYAMHGNTLVCVSPFWGGKNGINSYEKMEVLVRKVQDLLRKS